MKNFLLVSTAVLALFGAAAQNPTLYFMRGVPMRSQMNAALAPERGYVQIPLLGGLAVADDGNIALNNLVYRRGDQLTTLLDPSVSAAEALSGLHDRNRINADVRTTLIGFGSYTANRKNFWSFDLNLRAGASAQVPYELFHFFKTGESSRVRNMGVAADTYVEAGFNYSWPVCDRVYVGARVKALIGLARTRFYFNDFNVSLGEDQWFVEAVGELEANGAGVSIPTRTEVDGNGVEYQRGMKAMTIPAHNASSCRDVLVRCIKFVVPEDLSVSGGAMCSQRNFKVRFLAHHIDTDFRCCESLVTL